MPMPINRVPIFSDSVFNRYRLKRNRHRSEFFIGPINRSHQILTYICQRLSKGWNRRSRYVTDKNYIGQCLCQQKQSVNDWVFNVQTGWVRPSVYRRIVSCLSEMCIVSKKNLRQMPSSTSSYRRQYQTTWRIFVSSIFKRKIARWMHLRPLNPKRVIEESLLEGF